MQKKNLPVHFVSQSHPKLAHAETAAILRCMSYCDAQTSSDFLSSAWLETLFPQHSPCSRSPRPDKTGLRSGHGCQSCPPGCGCHCHCDSVSQCGPARRHLEYCYPAVQSGKESLRLSHLWKWYYHVWNIIAVKNYMLIQSS